jgi:predicted 3-demethylubiquinone-9 3-methyltransferase (glyoxalase superfamily)
VDQKVSPFLWFDDRAEEAANFYVSVFPDSRILDIARYADTGTGVPGSVMTVSFELFGQRFIALNGGPHFTFSEAVSFMIDCADQAEVDAYWEKLTDGGEPGACGWLKDKFGVSWQVTPSVLSKLLRDQDAHRAGAVVRAMMQMQKIDIAALEGAYREAPTSS